MAARFIDVDRLQNPKIRDALSPIYTKHPEEIKGSEWVKFAPEGPLSAIHALYPPGEESDKMLFQLSKRAVLHHPWAFAGVQARYLFNFFHSAFVPADIYWQPEYRFFLYRGLGLMMSVRERYPVVVLWLSQPPEAGRRSIRAFQDLLKLPPAEAQQQLQVLYANDPYVYEPICALWAPLAPFFKCYGWLALLGLAMGFWQLGRMEIQSAALCLLNVILAHAILIALRGDAIGRYAIPLEPLMWVLLISGLGKAGIGLKGPPGLLPDVRR